MSHAHSITERTTLEQLATLVCSALSAADISVVLSGGAAVSIYSDNEYESYDLDFIPIGLARRVDHAMKTLGFAKEGRHWRHPNNAYFVEFPSGPVAIGEEVIHDFAERRSAEGVLRILRPTECVMDRLSWYFHDADRQCLEQALQVARCQSINIERIERWAKKERPYGAERFEEFRDRLSEVESEGD